MTSLDVGLTPENFNLIRSNMAKIYLLTSVQDLNAPLMERMKESLVNITRTVAESFDELDIYFPAKIPVKFYNSVSSSSKLLPPAVGWSDGKTLIDTIRQHYKRDEHDSHDHRNTFKIFSNNIEYKNWSLIG